MGAEVFLMIIDGVINIMVLRRTKRWVWAHRFWLGMMATKYENITSIPPT